MNFCSINSSNTCCHVQWSLYVSAFETRRGCFSAAGSASTASARLWLKTSPDCARTSRRCPCRTWRTSWRASESTRTRSERRPWDRHEGRRSWEELAKRASARRLFDIPLLCTCLGAAASNLQQCSGQAGQHGPLHQACVLAERTDVSPSQPDDRRRHRRRWGCRWRG